MQIVRSLLRGELCCKRLSRAVKLKLLTRSLQGRRASALSSSVSGCFRDGKLTLTFQEKGAPKENFRKIHLQCLEAVRKEIWVLGFMRMGTEKIGVSLYQTWGDFMLHTVHASGVPSLQILGLKVVQRMAQNTSSHISPVLYTTRNCYCCTLSPLFIVQPTLGMGNIHNPLPMYFLFQICRALQFPHIFSHHHDVSYSRFLL